MEIDGNMKVQSGGRIKMRVKRVIIGLLSALTLVGATIGASSALNVKANTSYDDIEKFPDSYKTALYALKDKHPNWTFEVMDTGLNWSDVVYNEMNPSNRSLVPTYFDSKFVGAYYGDGWACATQEAVEYYLDPRNWLTEDYIFQFEKLTYNGNTQGIATVQRVLQNTFMSGFIQSDSQFNYEQMGLTYAQAFRDIGESIGVSPVHLATRVKQEQGTQGTSDLISGVYPGYEGYYNYYNIQASGKTHEEIVANGLNEARSEGWNNRYAALLGGSKKVAERYILRGQDTLYLQKFDVDGQYDGRYWHQYMQNLAAPSNEGRNIKKAYENAGLLNETFVFKIPVYNNMPREIDGAWQFAERMYSKILGREGSSQEIQSWANGIRRKNLTCSEVAYQFVFSDEYKSQNNNNASYVKMLYETLLRRIPAESEVNAWAELLDAGYSRKYVLQQFLLSPEFERVCIEWGLDVGSITVSDDEIYDTTENMQKYIQRMYSCILDRDATDLEMQNGMQMMKDSNVGCAGFTSNIIFSEEYKQKNTSDADYISVLYLALLRREPSNDEIQSWVNVLNESYSRKYVLKQFTSCVEYSNIWSAGHLSIGNIELNDDEIYNTIDNMEKYVERMYVNILGRSCSIYEKQSWTNGMRYNNITCAELAYQFIFSDEYKSMNTTNGQYVEMLYLALLRRIPNELEIQAWSNVLESGYSRKYVLQQFTSSVEFNNLWSSQRLVVGSISVSENELYDPDESIENYVRMLYLSVLGREAGYDEGRSVAYDMQKKQYGAAQIATDIIFCNEYLEKNTDNVEFVRMLYLALLRREPSDYEVTSWTDGLDLGLSREYAVQQFTMSEEYNRVCTALGLDVGTLQKDGN